MSLLDPVVFPGGARARNRVFLAPLTNSQSHEDGTLSEEELAWLARRAEGGFGLVSTCASHVTRDGKGFPGQLGCFDDSLVPGLSRVATSLRAHGALSVVQLVHAGVRTSRALCGTEPWGMSAVTEPLPGTDAARAGTSEELERVVTSFADAAVRAKEAGFDGVEMHAAHGYLLSASLSVIANRRTDDWGGSLENRMRLVRAVVKSARARLPRPFVIGVRLSPEDWGSIKGLDLDESLTVAATLADDGVDFVHLSLWNAHKNTAKRPDEHPIQLFRAAIRRDVPIVAAGHVWTRADADHLLSLGADAVALGRSAIVNPDWPLQCVDPAWQPRRPPVTAQELAAAAVSSVFVDYLRRWKDFVIPGGGTPELTARTRGAPGLGEERENEPRGGRMKNQLMIFLRFPWRPPRPGGSDLLRCSRVSSARRGRAGWWRSARGRPST
jgi:2,4-dienoyl-CoA reductase-like NADH-dependent reductase (Old Yellow Enzyme family)